MNNPVRLNCTNFRIVLTCK